MVTWNCSRGPYSRKMFLLESYRADLCVVQESPMPPAESEHCLWFGDNPRQGMLILSSPEYRLRALPQMPEVPRFIIPIEVIGPTTFYLLAVWSKAQQAHRYVEAVVRAVELYGYLFEQSEVVLMGDLNSNSIWDKSHPSDRNHSALVRALSAYRMVSGYHEYFREEHGSETRPTYFFRWKEERPYHIDYCFIPEEWSRRVSHVEIGSFLDWQGISDHRPLLVDVDEAQPRAVA